MSGKQSKPTEHSGDNAGTAVCVVVNLVAVNRLNVDAIQNVESRPEIFASISPGTTR